MKPRSALIAAIGLTATLIGLLRAAAPEAARATDPAIERLFVEKIYPLLEDKCLGCHGKDEKKIKGKYDMRTRAGLIKGGESGETALVPGNPQKSPLFVAATWKNEDLQMPPKENDRLTAEQIEQVRQWIAGGAPWPDAKTIAEVKKAAWSDASTAEGVIVKTSGGISDQWSNRRYQPDDLWAFEPVRKTTPPRTAAGVEHPVDAYLQAALEQRGLKPAAAADKLTLLRRATYDLTGLPPTQAEIEAFAADSSADAYEKLIDRLLASPRYGERMAQHWLDVVRYGDTSGGANDFERPNAWRYRDYVIRSFNADKPYDRFILEQLAGDEMEPANPEMKIAVGFIRMGPWEHTGMSVAAETRQQFLDDITNSVGQVFLGHAIGCAKCHDHKFDPIPARDYYSIMAAFAPVQFAEKQAPFLPEEKMYDVEAEKARIARLMEETQALQLAFSRKVFDAGLAYARERGADVSRFTFGEKKGKGAYFNPFASLPENQRPPRNYGLKDEDLGVVKVLDKRKDYLERMAMRFEPIAFTIYNGAPPDKPYTSNNVRNPIPQKIAGPAEQIHILTGGSIQSPGEPVKPGVLSAMEGSMNVRIPEKLNSRRLALARWIASPSNTLTARVMVNRLWQMHFGTGLVATPNSFGKMGKRPSNPELLDYLAAAFVDSGWSNKKLHKLIMTSDAYRRAGSHPEIAKLRQKDPGDELLARFPPRRLTAEELRDSMLLASGELNLTMYGPGIFPEINMEAALQPRHIMGSVAIAYQPSPRPDQRNRRTIYAYRYRGLPDPMLEVFNQPNADMSCERRDSTTVTPQVFALFNGQNSYDRALAMARRVEQAAADSKRRVDLAVRLALGRGASEGEIDLALAHIDRMAALHAGHPPRAIKPPGSVKRSMVEEMTGAPFEWDEPLDVFVYGYVSDLKPWDVPPATRALADFCLALLNSNEFVYVY